MRRGLPVVERETLFQHEQELVAAAQVFFTLEADAVAIGLAGLETGLGTETRIAHLKAHTHQAVDRDIRLGIRAAGNQAGDGQSDNFLLHIVNLLVVEESVPQ